MKYSSFFRDNPAGGKQPFLKAEKFNHNLNISYFQMLFKGSVADSSVGENN